jgi:hypothetical protein
VASNRLVFTGLSELRAELRALPAALTGEASSLVQGAATSAAAAIQTAYGAHRRSGNLQDHVVVETRAAGQFGAAMIVKATAKHAGLFENGSQARHTAIGANRGSMPPGHVFVPEIIRARRAMWGALADLLTRHGLRVTGYGG